MVAVKKNPFFFFFFLELRSQVCFLFVCKWWNKHSTTDGVLIPSQEYCNMCVSQPFEVRLNRASHDMKNPHV